jgi:hypothetical protein
MKRKHGYAPRPVLLKTFPSSLWTSR